MVLRKLNSKSLSTIGNIDYIKFLTAELKGDFLQHILVAHIFNESNFISKKCYWLTEVNLAFEYFVTPGL